MSPCFAALQGACRPIANAWRMCRSHACQLCLFGEQLRDARRSLFAGAGPSAQVVRAARERPDLALPYEDLDSSDKVWDAAWGERSVSLSWLLSILGHDRQLSYGLQQAHQSKQRSCGMPSGRHVLDLHTSQSKLPQAVMAAALALWTGRRILARR